jgi:hypothetical protein
MAGRILINRKMNSSSLNLNPATKAPDPEAFASTMHFGYCWSKMRRFSFSFIQRVLPRGGDLAASSPKHIFYEIHKPRLRTCLEILLHLCLWLI